VFTSKLTGAVISPNSVLEERRKVKSVQQTLFYHNVSSKEAVEHLRYRLRIYPGGTEESHKNLSHRPSRRHSKLGASELEARELTYTMTFSLVAKTKLIL
jgi:hypothetical protein